MTENTANIGFEKEIWDAACILRGNMDAAEYKQVVLGLIFLKYISDNILSRLVACTGDDSVPYTVIPFFCCFFPLFRRALDSL